MNSKITEVFLPWSSFSQTVQFKTAYPLTLPPVWVSFCAADTCYHVSLPPSTTVSHSFFCHWARFMVGTMKDLTELFFFLIRISLIHAFLYVWNCEQFWLGSNCMKENFSFKRTLYVQVLPPSLLLKELVFLKHILSNRRRYQTKAENL